MKKTTDYPSMRPISPKFEKGLDEFDDVTSLPKSELIPNSMVQNMIKHRDNMENIGENIKKTLASNNSDWYWEPNSGTVRKDKFWYTHGGLHLPNGPFQGELPESPTGVDELLRQYAEQHYLAELAEVSDMLGRDIYHDKKRLSPDEISRMLKNEHIYWRWK